MNWPLGLALGGIVLALLALGLALRPVLGHWRYRRRFWLETPDRLLDPQPRPPLLLGGALALGLVVAVLGMIQPAVPLMPLATFVAASACLTVAHVRFSVGAGYVGLGLVALTLITAGAAWLQPQFALGASAGCALAGLFLLWLANFWAQQLLDGEAWTTAGRLIPLARNLGYLVAGIAAAVAASGWGTYLLTRGSETPAPGPLWLIWGAAALLLGLALLVTRDSAQQTRGWGSAAAWAAALAAALVLALRQPESAAVFANVVIVVSLIGALLLPIARLRGIHGMAGWPHAVSATVILPLAIGIGWVLNAEQRELFWPWLLSLVFVVLGNALWWWPLQPLTETEQHAPAEQDG